MLIDITLKITPKMATEAQSNENKALVGHLGTHFDIMDKEFPLEYTRRSAVIFDVSGITGRDIEIDDILIDSIENNMFVAFYSGYIEKIGYGSKEYFSEHPQLSNELITALVNKGISIIGIDFPGIRRGKEHTATDRYCANNGVFIIENLCNLNSIIGKCIIYTFPMNYTGITGLPCRVIADL